VTAETVMVLPVLVAVALGLAWVLALAATQVRVVDAAREVARAAARDESRSTALALGRRVAPHGSSIDLRVHDLRHTYASLARRAGADLRLLQKTMGHASITVTAHIYADLYDDELDDVAWALDALDDRNVDQS